MILNYIFRTNIQLNIALLDQALISGVNFLTGILLARALDVTLFGKYSILLLIIFLLTNIQSALVIQPLMIILPQYAKNSIEEKIYLGSVMFQQVGLSALTSLAASLFALWQGVDFLLTFLMAMTFLMQDYMRRFFFSRRDPLDALLNDFISYGGQLFGLLLLFLFKNLTLTNCLLVISFTSIIAVVFGYYRYHAFIFKRDEIWTVAKRHFQSGRWLLGASFAQWAGSQGLILAGGIFIGGAAVGGIRAVINLTAVVNIVQQGLQNVLPVKASAYLNSEGPPAAIKYLAKTGSLTLVAVGLIVTLVSVFRVELMQAIYGKSYLLYADLVILQSVYTVLFSMASPFLIFYRIVERSHICAIAYAISSLASLLLLITCMEFGVNAIYISLIASQLVLLICCLSVFNACYKENKGAFLNESTS